MLHQQQMAALLKRIQRDRNEQLKHRQKGKNLNLINRFSKIDPKKQEYSG